MYNTHPLISTQEVSISAKNDDMTSVAYVIVSCHQEVVALVAGSSQHGGGNKRMTTRSDVT